jgi:hypothetical protein
LTAPRPPDKPCNISGQFLFKWIQAPFHPIDFYAHSTAFFHLLFFGDNGRSIAHANADAFTNSFRSYSDSFTDSYAAAYANSVVPADSQT